MANDTLDILKAALARLRSMPPAERRAAIRAAAERARRANEPDAAKR